MHKTSDTKSKMNLAQARPVLYLILQHSAPGLCLILELQHDKTIMTCVPRELRSTQSDQFLLCAQWVGRDPNFLDVGSFIAQTGQMPRLI